MKNSSEKEKDGKGAEIKKRFCSFKIQERLFGVDIMNVKEITSELSFTPIFHAPKEVKGYLNIRGQIHLVVDLRMLLGFDGQEKDANSCVVLFKQEAGEAFGILVDKIGDVIEINEGRIEYHNDTNTQYADDENENLNAQLVPGVCKLENELMEILNSKEILEIIEKEASQCQQ